MITTSRRESFKLGAGLALGAAAPLASAEAQTQIHGTESDARFLARLLGRDKLLWSPNVQAEGYKSLERILATRRIPRAAQKSVLPNRPIPTVTYTDAGREETLDDFLRLEHVAGLLAIRDGTVHLERYGLGLAPHEHWTSMSMVKSLTSTLVGCALHDRLLPGLHVTAGTYVPELRGSAYDDVTLRQLLMMTSGVAWDEDYTNPDADVNLHYEKVIADREKGGILRHLRTLRRVQKPGSAYSYNTADTFVIGCMLTKAIGGRLADYCSSRIWSRIGTEQDALFLLESDDGQEVAGSSASASLRDYGRFGMFILADGVAGGRRILPESWVAQATAPSAPRFDLDGGGYGYQWWTYADGSYAAEGFAGQVLRINPKARTVLVILSALPGKQFRDPAETSPTRRQSFYTALDAALENASKR
ncbi:serine hydrolase domain-containing protein [Sphingomonas sp. ac-8]|uniref:serine hydrolase domain-containing protein n=1 Tax=Sphingomonas sp. ac-8 TaxID=3242977 RepID=UPI003A7FE9C0